MLLEHIIKEDIQPVNAQLYSSNYKVAILRLYLPPGENPIAVK